MELSWHFENLAATETFGVCLGRRLFPGAVLALVGQLGAGKTHLTRAIARGLDVKQPGAVTSPTFVLIQEYRARLPIYHFDAYRLRGAIEFQELGVQEYFESDGVCIVEWADRVAAAMPSECLQIRLEVISESSRHLHAHASSPNYEALLTDLRADPDLASFAIVSSESPTRPPHGSAGQGGPPDPRA